MGSRVCGIIVGMMLFGIAGVVCLTSSLFSAPPAPVVHQGEWEMRSTPEVVRYHVAEDAQRIQLTLDLQVDTGRLEWAVTDPAGEVCWQGHLTAEHAVLHTRHFQAIPGDWQLELALSDTSGQFEARWESQS